MLLEPSLRNLSYLLRHPELWPAGFQFNFAHRQTCAMGLAHRVWGQRHMPWPYFAETAELLGISPDLAFRLFVLAPSRVVSYCDVMPELLADRIDEALSAAGSAEPPRV